MVIDIINIQPIITHKSKNHPPVGTDSNRPEAPQFTFERVEPEARQVHIRRSNGRVKTRENVSQFNHMFTHHASWIIVIVKTF